MQVLFFSIDIGEHNQNTIPSVFDIDAVSEVKKHKKCVVLTCATFIYFRNILFDRRLPNVCG